MPPHIVRYPPIQCNTRERCDQLQIPAAPPAWRVPEGPDSLAAVPMGDGGAWPGFEATHNRASAAGVEGAGGSGGPGRASRSTTPSRQARVWRSRGRAAAHRHIQRPGPTKQAPRRPEICRGNKPRQTINPPKCIPIQPKPSVLSACHLMGLHFGRNNAPDRGPDAT